jgi:hypothetical protein
MFSQRGSASSFTPSMLPVSWSIIHDSLDEAEFLWHRRDVMLNAHDQTLGDVETWVEDRLLGAIDGLTVAGKAGVNRVLAPALDSDESSRVSAAAYASLSGGTAEGMSAFRSAFLAGTKGRLGALQRGLELVPVAINDLAPAMTNASPQVLAGFLEARAFNRH